MRKILITSFGSFADFDSNPSEQVMRALMSDPAFTGRYEASFQNLPVTYPGVQEFYAGIEDIYDLVVHMGVASQEKRLRLELRAQNRANGTDASGLEKQHEYIIDGQGDLHCSLDRQVLDEMVRRHPEEVRTSEDAGHYLCNYIYYLALQKQAAPSVIFIHIADWMHEPEAVSMDRQVELVKNTIDLHFQGSSA